MRNWHGNLSPFGRWHTAGALSAYAILGFEPPLVLDFDENFYRTGGTATDLVSAATHTRAGNATMVDSDGVLKWGPHNEVRQTNFASGWIAYSSSISASGVLTESGASGFQTVYQPGSSGVYTRTLKCHFTPINRDFAVLSIGPTAANWAAATFDLANGVVTKTQGSGSGTLVSSSILADGDGYMCEITVSGISASYYYIGASDTGTTAYGSYGLPTYLGNSLPAFSASTPHLYRSDLGGMVNNPVTGDSYVPTTSAAVYLPRVGHHIYNGSAWIDEGYFHESEARTNLIVDSLGLSTISSAGAGTVTTSATGAPLGSGAAVRRVQGAAANEGAIIPFTVASAGTYISYIYARSRTGLPQNVKVTNSGNTGPTIALPANGAWVMVVGNPVALGAGVRDMRILQVDSSIDIDVSLPQSEFASTPSSYIPTSGSTVTRAADTMTIPAVNMPWPGPAVIGPELVTNGTFDTDVDGWTLIGSGSLEWNASGAIDVTSTTNIVRASQSFTTVAGHYYKVSGELVVDPGNDYFQVGTAAGGGDLFGVLNSTAGLREGYFAAVGTTTYISIGTFTGQTATFDNISVREINPLAVSIQMEGTMTYADTDTGLSSGGGGGEVNFFLWRGGSDTYIQTGLNTLAYRTGEVVFAQRQSTSGLDGVITTGNYYSPDINVPFNISSRHGSTFINGAVDGTALTANLTPTALPDLSATNMQIGSVFMGTIKQFRVWADDLTDAGIAEATLPSLEPSLSLTFDGSETSFTVLDWSA